MNLDIFRIVFAAIVAFLISFAATPVSKRIAAKLGAIDVPKDTRRMHKAPIPRLGGLAIFYGFIVAILCFCNIDTQLRGVLIATVIIVALGILDDCMDLHAIIKLFVQIGAAMIVIMHGVQIEYITNPFAADGAQYIPFGIWSVPITILWIVGVTNALNLIDGLDGLAVGVSTVSAISIFTIALLVGETNLALIAAVVAGASFGFAPYNMYPASSFMGDTGATFLGFILSCVSVMGLFKGYTVVSVAVPFLVLGIPLFDTTFAIIRRLLKGQSPMTPDRGHLHHRLIDMGFDQRQTVGILIVGSALLSLSAVVLMLSDIYRAILLILAVTLLTYGGMKLLQTNDEIKEQDDAKIQ